MKVLWHKDSSSLAQVVWDLGRDVVQSKTCSGAFIETERCTSMVCLRLIRLLTFETPVIGVHRMFLTTSATNNGLIKRSCAPFLVAF